MDQWSVERGGAELAVTETGTGPPVVLLHAGVADSRGWVTVMEALAGQARLVAYDRRGHGGTTAANEPFAALGDLLAVLDAAGIERAVLVGASRGGQLAFEAAVRVPERVTALVLVGSAPLGAPAAEEHDVLDTLFDAIDAAEEAGDVHEVNRLEARLWLDGPLAPEGRVAGAARELFLAMNLRALEAGVVGEEADLEAGWDDLVRLTAPVLVVVGDEDLPVVVDRARQMAHLVPDAELAVLEGSAHLPMVDQPDVFAAVLARFLARLGRP